VVAENGLQIARPDRNIFENYQTITKDGVAGRRTIFRVVGL